MSEDGSLGGEREQKEMVNRKGIVEGGDTRDTRPTVDRIQQLFFLISDTLYNEGLNTFVHCPQRSVTDRYSKIKI